MLYPPVADLDLWVSTAAAVLARGRSLADAVETADRVIAAFWRNQRVVQRGPGIAKCRLVGELAASGGS